VTSAISPIAITPLLMQDRPLGDVESTKDLLAQYVVKNSSTLRVIRGKRAITKEGKSVAIIATAKLWLNCNEDTLPVSLSSPMETSLDQCIYNWQVLLGKGSLQP
jgi:hypothetical protein